MIVVLAFVALLIWAKVTEAPNLVFWPLAGVAICAMAVFGTIGHLAPKVEPTLGSLKDELRAYRTSRSFIVIGALLVAMLASIAVLVTK